jgi:hypothetical protein
MGHCVENVYGYQDLNRKCLEYSRWNCLMQEHASS